MKCDIRLRVPLLLQVQFTINPPFVSRGYWQVLYVVCITMKTQVSRRSFVKRSALAAGVLASAPFNILHAQNKGEKIRFVQIGCGGRGMEHINRAIKEQFTALVEVNEQRVPAVQKWAKTC